MKYLCLIYDNEQDAAKMSAAEQEALMGEYFTLTKQLGEGGQLLGGEELAPSHTATTVRVRAGKMSATDGPFAEAREQLGGYFLVEAPDLNAAMHIAARIPNARTGAVEVRPIIEHPAD